MTCREIADLLARLLPAADGSPLVLHAHEEAVLRELVSRGLVQTVEAPGVDPSEIARLRASLADTIRRREETEARLETEQEVAAGAGDFGAGGDQAEEAVERLEAELDAIDAEAGGIRRRILDLSEDVARLEGSVAVGGSRHAVSYRGRALLTDLLPRLDRFGAGDLRAFEAEMAWLRDTFGARASKAAQILRSIANVLPGLGEIHCRAVAVGLSARRGEASDVARAFLEAAHALSGTSLQAELLPVAAECLCLQETPDAAAAARDLGTFFHDVLSSYRVVGADGLHCALVLHPLDALGRAQALTEAVRLGSNQPPGQSVAEITPFALLAAEGAGADPRTPERFWRLHGAIRARASDAPYAAMAAAILTMAGVPEPDELLRRFGLARDYLSRFSENGMAVPAAMLAILSSDVEETLDDLRLAARAIHDNRLSLGGMENMSLAVKLLMHSAAQADAAPAPAEAGYRDLPGAEPPTGHSLGVAGLTVALPVALSTLSAFHEVTLHRLAESDFEFHPVHSPWVYG